MGESVKVYTVSCRFSRDVETIDNNLPQNFRMFLNTFFGAVSVFVVISYSTPLFLTIILPMAILYYLVQVSIAQYSTFITVDLESTGMDHVIKE